MRIKNWMKALLSVPALFAFGGAQASEADCSWLVGRWACQLEGTDVAQRFFRVDLAADARGLVVWTNLHGPADQDPAPDTLVPSPEWQTLADGFEQRVSCVGNGILAVQTRDPRQDGPLHEELYAPLEAGGFRFSTGWAAWQDLPATSMRFLCERD